MNEHREQLTAYLNNALIVLVALRSVAYISAHVIARKLFVQYLPQNFHIMTTTNSQQQEQTKAAINKQILELKKKIQLSGRYCDDQIFFDERRTVNVCFAWLRFSTFNLRFVGKRRH